MSTPRPPAPSSTVCWPRPGSDHRGPRVARFLRWCPVSDGGDGRGPRRAGARATVPGRPRGALTIPGRDRPAQGRAGPDAVPRKARGRPRARARLGTLRERLLRPGAVTFRRPQAGVRASRRVVRPGWPGYVRPRRAPARRPFACRTSRSPVPGHRRLADHDEVILWPSTRPFRPRRSPTAPRIVVRLDLVAGRLELIRRLDRRTAHLLHDAISALLQTDHPRWVVDVTGLTVCDRGGLRALNTAHHRSLRHHRKMTLLGASSTLQRGAGPAPAGGERQGRCRPTGPHRTASTRPCPTRLPTPGDVHPR
jgi:anti-anti-sigma regulatory factor